MAPIAPPCPAREAREAGLHRMQHSSTADVVKGVVEVKLDHRLPSAVAVPVNPCTGSVHSSFGPCWHAQANLSWPKRGAHIIPDLAEEALPNEAAKNHGPNATVRLGHCDKGSTSQASRHTCRNMTPR